MLVMRQKLIEEEFGVFNAITSISQIDGGDLSQRIENALPQMTDFETHHFSPSSRTNFNQMFHRPFNTCLVTKNQALSQKTQESYQIQELQISEGEQVLNGDMQLCIVYQSASDELNE